MQESKNNKQQNQQNQQNQQQKQQNLSFPVCFAMYRKQKKAMCRLGRHGHKISAMDLSRSMCKTSYIIRFSYHHDALQMPEFFHLPKRLYRQDSGRFAFEKTRYSPPTFIRHVDRPPVHLQWYRGFW